MECDGRRRRRKGRLVKQKEAANLRADCTLKRTRRMLATRRDLETWGSTESFVFGILCF